MLSEADAGKRWLKSLTEVEPPPNLVHNILVATTGYESKHAAVAPNPRALDRQVHRLAAAGVAPVLAVSRQPRFAMSFGMAFFSLSISLSLAGVKVSDVRHVDLRPSAIKRTYYETTGRVVKYYENIRFVYEIESRMRELNELPLPPKRAPRSRTRNKKITTPVENLSKNRNATTARERTSPCWLPSRMIRL